MKETELSRKERKRLRNQKPDDNPRAVVVRYSKEEDSDYWVGIEQTFWAHEAMNVVKEREGVSSLHHLDKSEAVRLASEIDKLTREIEKRGPQS